MPIPVVCPSCQHKFGVPERFAGKRGKCPKCASVFRAPAGEPVLVASQAAPVDAPVAAPPLAPDDDIPVGVAIESEPPLGDSVPAAPPALPFIMESRPLPTGSHGHGPKHAAPKARAGTSPLVLAGIGGGIVLLAGLLAVAIWTATGGFNSEPVADASKPAKKPAERKSDRQKGVRSESVDEPSKPEKPGGIDEQDDGPRELGRLPEFEKPESPIPPAVIPSPIPPPPAADALSVESIEKLAQQCAIMNWKPADAEDFKKLQILARLVTQATVAEEGAADLPEEQAKLAAAGQAVIKTLSETAWASDAKLAELNRLSAASLSVDEPGVFAYGTARGMTEGDRRLLLLALDGTTEMVAVPVKTTKLETPEGSRWLVLGYRVGQAVQIDIRGNGMDRTIRPQLVNVTHLIGEPGSE